MGTLALSALLISGQANAWNKDDYKDIRYTKLTFDNRLNSAIKVQKLSVLASGNSGEEKGRPLHPNLQKERKHVFPDRTGNTHRSIEADVLYGAET